MIKLFIRRPVFTTMLVMLLVVFGVTSYPSLGIDLYPDIDFPIVTVRITYTGASPEGAYARSAAGEEVWQGRVRFPAEKIVGAAGAGDAFAAC